MDYQKIYEALTTISTTCKEMREKYNSCKYCPMADSWGECNIWGADKEPPLNWILVEPEKAVRLISQ